MVKICAPVFFLVLPRLLLFKIPSRSLCQLARDTDMYVAYYVIYRNVFQDICPEVKQFLDDLLIEVENRTNDDDCHKRKLEDFPTIFEELPNKKFKTEVVEIRIGDDILKSNQTVESQIDNPTAVTSSSIGTTTPATTLDEEYVENVGKHSDIVKSSFD